MMKNCIFSSNFFVSILNVFMLVVGRNSLIILLLTSLGKTSKKLITIDAFSMCFGNLHFLALNVNFGQENDII